MVFRKYKKDRRKKKSEKTNTDERGRRPGGSFPLRLLLSRLSLSHKICLPLFFREKG